MYLSYNVILLRKNVLPTNQMIQMNHANSTFGLFTRVVHTSLHAFTNIQAYSRTVIMHLLKLATE